MIRFACPQCQKVYGVSSRDAGTKFNCDGCGQRIQVPVPQSHVAPAGNTNHPAARNPFIWVLPCCLLLAVAGGFLLAFALRTPPGGTQPSGPPVKPADTNDSTLAQQ